MYFRVCFHTHAYVILTFLSFHQDSHYQSDIDHSHQAQIQYFHVLHLQKLPYYYPAEGFNPQHN